MRSYLIKCYVQITKRSCRFLSDFSKGLKKVVRYSEKIIIGSIKFCQACDKLIWKAPNSSLDKGKLQFG